MNNKELALITIAIIVGCCIIGGFVYAGLTVTKDSADNDTLANNTTNKLIKLQLMIYSFIFHLLNS